MTKETRKVKSVSFEVSFNSDKRKITISYTTSNDHWHTVNGVNSEVYAICNKVYGCYYTVENESIKYVYEDEGSND